ncbi:MAG: hypothetical protein RQ826_09445 [Xanthomonadales bacterium]|nr:hypothetical protein [Xanthomonadales bacterium]
MPEATNRLYDLLPLIYRQRDHEQGEPLKALLQVMSEQLEVVEQDISRLYDNWFIETCDDWVVPYIGELIGYDVLHEGGEVAEAASASDRLRNALLIPRAEVANTIRYRRRKGTLALLELLARSVAGWPARAVEFRALLQQTQDLDRLAPVAGRSIDVRRVSTDRLDGPFDTETHLVDVRRINSSYCPGRYNCPSVGLFVWRLQTFPLTRSPAYCLEAVNPSCFTFSALGNDTPLYVDARPETDDGRIAGEINLPLSITRPLLRRRADELYGPGKSLQLWVGEPGKDQAGEVELVPVAASDIEVADLSDWKLQPSAGKVAIDPERGRIAFPPRRAPRHGVWVSYHHAFSTAMGGGEYTRTLHEPEEAEVYEVGQDRAFETINAALKQWQEDDPDHAAIEISDSRVYVEPVNIDFSRPRTSLQLRAANRSRPVIRMLDWQTDKADALVVAGERDNRFTLDGILLAGRGMQLAGGLCKVTVCHSTLVPGWGIGEHCEPARPAEPSIEVYAAKVCLEIRHSIVGSIQLDPAVTVVEVAPEPPRQMQPCDEDSEEAPDPVTEIRLDPVRICIADSILDATDEDREAIGAPGCPVAHARLEIRRSTVLGKVQVDRITLAENAIFMGRVRVARRQSGCIRFSYVTPGSRTPRRYRCQPDLVTEGLVEPQLTRQQKRVEPLFNSVRYGTPEYCQLSFCCAGEIVRGADDEAEMGAFHDLYQPQRQANLLVRLNEYTPAATDVGILFEN